MQFRLNNSTRNLYRGYWYRFAMALAAMVVLNIQQLFLTWGAYGSCGFECIGFPFSFHTLGGVAGGSYFLPLHLFGDIVIALVIAHVAARALKNGLPALIHHLRTWGLKELS